MERFVVWQLISEAFRSQLHWWDWRCTSNRLIKDGRLPLWKIANETGGFYDIPAVL